MKTILIKNGYVVDPKQNVNEKINVLIKDGKIAALTYDFPEADVIIDASEKIVSPGFIDIHTHEDEYDIKTGKILTGMSESALRMGVTLRVCGNCGINVYDPAEYLDTTDRDGAPVNIGLMAGHTFLRNLKGERNKYEPVSVSDIQNMLKAAESYLESGCLGISFGLKYIPGTTRDEIMALVRLCKKQNKLITAHVRNDVDGVFAATDELAEIGKSAQVRVQFSHIGSMGGYGQMTELLKKIENYRNDEVDIMCDCYPYDAFSTAIGETTYDDGFLASYRADYDSILIVSGKYAGQRCNKEIFKELRATAPHTATVGYFMRGEDIDTALTSPLVMLGSDGIRQDGKGHPRASGTFARFIKNYIKTGKVTLIDGISKMTSMPADRLGLLNKGNLIVGSDADVVIFDLKKVKDNATYENGQLPSEGFSCVLIGGDVALINDKIINNRLGRAVRC